MIRSLLLLLGTSLLLEAAAQDQSYSDCVIKSKTAWGEVCEKCESYKGYKRDYSGTFQVELKNACKETVEVKVAVQESNGTWRTFPIRTLMAEQTTTVFACQGTGKYLYWVRRMNDTEIVLPTDPEIASEFKQR